MDSIQRTSPDEMPAKPRHWTGNDTSNREQHESVPLLDMPMYLRLSWRRDSQSQPREVACMNLDLSGLLSEGLVRPIGADHVRVRFVHDDDGHVYLLRTQNGPRWRVSEAPF